MFLYYPIILIGLTTTIASFPAPILYHHSRMQFLYSHVSTEVTLGSHPWCWFLAVALGPQRSLSRRVHGFFSWWYVLFPNIHDDGKPYPSCQSKIVVKLVKNLQVFFCLYSISWDNPNSCRSSHSRLQGFFSALPAIWRIFQCLRRYYDTRNAFPHLANCGKYTFTVLYYMALSMYQIDGNHAKLVVFIAFALCNTFYSGKLSLPFATAETMR